MKARVYDSFVMGHLREFIQISLSIIVPSNFSKSVCA